MGKWSRLAAWVFLAVAVASAPAQTVLRGPYLQSGTPTSMVVRWVTNVPTDGEVRFGTSPGILTQSVAGATQIIDHAVEITGLQPDTRYYYAVADVALGILAGNDAEHFFFTAPPVGTEKPTRIWAIGDSGTADDAARAVRDAYYTYTGERRTDVWLMLGDNAYELGTQLDYQVAVFQNMYEDLLRQTPVWPCFGNHDAVFADSGTQTGPYYDIFNLPTAGEAGGLASGTEAYYSFDHANIHFVVLDSTGSDRSPGGAMLTWLAADLAATAQDWLIAYWHHPPYSRGSHDSDNPSGNDIQLVEMRQNALPILEAHGVDLVLSGHSHSYERSMLIDSHYGDSTTFDPATMAVDTGDGRITGGGAYRKASVGGGSHEGTVYSVAGSSGRLTPAVPLDHPVMVESLPLRGSVVIDVVDDQLDMRFLDEDGLLRDSFTIVKGGATPVETFFVPLQPGAIWRFEDTGTDLGAACVAPPAPPSWACPGFDDSGWGAGPAPLGFGETFIQTPVSFGSPLSVHPTTYFRKTFQIAALPQAFDALILGLNFDDGFIAYLNGVEVARDSMPAGPVGFATLALPHEGGQFDFFDVSPHAGLLVEGANVLAIEVHQATAFSSDLVLDAILGYQAFTPVLGPCAIGNAGTGSGAPIDTFFVNGSAGGAARSVDVSVNQIYTLSIPQPPTTLAPARFLLFGSIGTPPPSAAFVMPFNLGTTCFTPSLLAPGFPGLFLLANSFAPGGALVPSTPTPWSLVALPVPVPFNITFQGLIEDTPGSVSLTNAIRVRYTVL